MIANASLLPARQSVTVLFIGPVLLHPYFLFYSDTERRIAAYYSRPRRRSGSALVEADKVSGGGSVAGDDAYSMMVMMGSLENGPHREMPVDVPDSFIARSKTPPRYPPPRPAARGAVNGNAGSPGKPVPPPREPVPRPPPPAASRTINNNTTAELSKEPTKQQLDSIKKYQVSQ
ncbi:GuKc [Nesidiocoris tenuis]|uniref:GuKc n=1 Tax=Nesidiocoris tenuis TaxID=355587 RepID=A0ABN7B8W7_9HEMI|nr:GuKc [Nesidiocoris tenuis]